MARSVDAAAGLCLAQGRFVSHGDALNISNDRDECAGIGKSIATRLARQGLNVVLVALGDSLLDNTFEELKAAYPKCQFRKVRGD